MNIRIDNQATGVGHLKKPAYIAFAICLALTLAWALVAAMPANSLADTSPAKAASNAKKATYSITAHKKTAKYGSITAKWRYDQPKLKGSTKAIKKINKSLKADYKKDVADSSEPFGTAKSASKSYTRPATYYLTAKAKATYNKKGIISFRHKHNWYCGGVPNEWVTGHTYSLKTGKKLNVSDVVPGTAKQVKSKIANKFIDKFYSRLYDDEDHVRQMIMDTKISDFEFCLKDGKVIVYFGPYPPGLGNGMVSITLKGDYA